MMIYLSKLLLLLLLAAVVASQERNNWSWGPDGAASSDTADKAPATEEETSGRSFAPSDSSFTVIAAPALSSHSSVPLQAIHEPSPIAGRIVSHTGPLVGVQAPVQHQSASFGAPHISPPTGGHAPSPATHTGSLGDTATIKRGDGQSEGRFLGIKDKFCEYGLGFDCHKKGYHKGGLSHHDISYVQPVQVVPVGGPIAAVPVHHKGYHHTPYVPPAPVYHPPAPVYHPPPPAYHPPPPTYHAPQSSYAVAPASSYGAPPKASYGAPHKAHTVSHTHTHHHQYSGQSSFGYAKDNSFGSNSPLSTASSFGSIDKIGSSLPVVPPRPSPTSNSFAPISNSFSSHSSFGDCKCVEARYCPLSDVIPRNSKDILPLINARSKKTDILSTADDDTETVAASEDSKVVVNPEEKEEDAEKEEKGEETGTRRRRDVIFEDSKRDTRDTMIFRDTNRGSSFRPQISSNSRQGASLGGCRFGEVCCRNPNFRQQREISTCGRHRNTVGLLGRVKNPHFEQGDTEFGEYPWHGGILRREESDNVYVCGAALIDSIHLVTAAHCVSGLVPQELKIRLGEWDVGGETEFYRHQERRVSGLYTHPDFYSGNLNNDIAVIKMNSPIDFSTNPHISPICLPDRFATFSSQRCHVSGWGKDAFGDHGSFQHVLKEVDLPMVSRSSCENALRSTRLGRQFSLHDGMICAGGEEGKDACEGDGGSPLVCRGFDGSEQLAGLVSWGLGCGQRGLPGVYTAVANYVDWVRSITRT